MNQQEQWPSELDEDFPSELQVAAARVIPLSEHIQLQHIREYNRRNRESFERDIQPFRDASEQLGFICRLALVVAAVAFLIYSVLELISKTQ